MYQLEDPHNGLQCYAGKSIELPRLMLFSVSYVQIKANANSDMQASDSFEFLKFNNIS